MLVKSSKAKLLGNYRSSRLEVFCRKGVVRNFAKFTGKHPCQSLFFNKVASLGSATLLKKSLWYRCFPVNFVKFLRTPFFLEHLRWLLLNYGSLVTVLVVKFLGNVTYVTRNRSGNASSIFKI